MQKEVPQKNIKRKKLRNISLCLFCVGIFGVIMLCVGLTSIVNNTEKNLSAITSEVKSVYYDETDKFYCITIKENETIYRIAEYYNTENLIETVPVGSEIKIMAKTSLIGREYAEIYALSLGENEIIKVNKMIENYYFNHLGAVIIGGVWAGVFSVIATIILIIALKKPKEVLNDYVEKEISEEYLENYVFYKLEKKTSVKKLNKRQNITIGVAIAYFSIIILFLRFIETSVLYRVILAVLIVGGIIAVAVMLWFWSPKLNGKNADKYANDYLEYMNNCKYIDEENEYEFSENGLVYKTYHDPDIDEEEEVSEEVEAIEASVPKYIEGEKIELKEVPEEIARDLEKPLIAEEKSSVAEYVTEAVIPYGELNLYAACRYKENLQVATIFICSNIIYENIVFGKDDLVLELTPKFYYDIKQNDVYVKGLDYLTHNFAEEIRTHAKNIKKNNNQCKVVKYENY